MIIVKHVLWYNMFSCPIPNPQPKWVSRKLRYLPRSRDCLLLLRPHTESHTLHAEYTVCGREVLAGQCQYALVRSLKYTFLLDRCLVDVPLSQVGATSSALACFCRWSLAYGRRTSYDYQSFYILRWQHLQLRRRQSERHSKSLLFIFFSSNANT